jgi:hypothetical protein
MVAPQIQAAFSDSVLLVCDEVDARWQYWIWNRNDHTPCTNNNDISLPEYDTDRYHSIVCVSASNIDPNRTDAMSCYKSSGMSTRLADDLLGKEHGRSYCNLLY